MAVSELQNLKILRVQHRAVHRAHLLRVHEVPETLPLGNTVLYTQVLGASVHFYKKKLKG